MELHHRRMRRRGLRGPQVFGMHARSADAGEIQVEALGERRVQRVRYQLNPRVERAHLGQPALPVGIKISRAGIASLVVTQLLQRHIDKRHGGLRYSSVDCHQYREGVWGRQG